MIGTTLGNFEIHTLLGRGGMGEVYQAKDRKLGRDVAIKVLPKEFAKDGDRVARFQREAKLLASLNHPNIAAIYGLEESGGTNLLVLELVEGETLADQIKKGPISVEESLKLALQIAEALEAAHEKGVIHRDLKPANLKCTPDGKVKVLDFGLAKAFAGEQENLNLSNSPTLSNAATQQGVILGTAAYMSPEQAKGKTVDKRSDIWAFGAVLFEMLASKPAFAGDDVSEILASVIKGEAHLDLLPANLHPRVREAITRCLQKDLKKRYPDIVDARYEIEQSLADSGGLFVQPVAAAEPRMRLRTILAWIAATAILSVLVTGIVMRQLKPSASPKSVSRLSITLPASQRLGPQMAFALSPDGTKLAYVASQGNTRQIYLRRLDSFEAEPLAGTEGAQALSFSPDGQWLGFTASDSGRLMKVPIQGGAPLPLADVYSPTGMCWGENGTILLSPNYGIGGLVQISATGSSPIQVTRARDTKSEGHRWPQLLPGGQAVLFTAWRRNIEDCRIMVHFLKTGRQKVLVEGGTDGRYVPTGHLIFVRQGSLFAVPFDAERMELKGTSVPILNGVGESREGAGWLSVSNQGSLVYSGVRVESIERVLVWVDREGKEQPLEVPPRPYISPRLSPDGNRIAVTIQAANDEIWSYDIPNRKFNRLTFQGRNSVPVWTPDGKRIAFRSDLGGDGALNLFWMLSDGSGAAERLMKSEHFQAASSWSPDGKFLALNQSHPTNNNDIWILPLDKALKPYAFLQTRFAERGGAFSPDGRWIAYSSNETGQYQVHIRPFPGPGGVWQVSTDGGDYPVWARNWELFYSNGNKMMAVKVETIPTFNASPPKMLFEGTSLSFFDVTPDGKRFLKVKSTAQGQQPEQINVVLNWTEELKQRVPAK